MARVELLTRRQIDIVKWNSTIDVSKPTLPYAYSWYLDAVSENWEAVILNDYEALLPVPWFRKLGIKCNYQPYYCQQLGFFMRRQCDPVLMQGMFRKAVDRRAFVDMNLNSNAASILGGRNFNKRKNLVLDLSREYPAIAKDYSENHKRNLKKAQAAQLRISDALSLLVFQDFFIHRVGESGITFNRKHKQAFIQLTHRLMEEGKAVIYAALDESKLYSAILVVKHFDRLIALINCNSSEGKRKGTSHFLFDSIIKKYAGQPLLFDFEGSSIASIARFYEGFGASDEPYLHYHHQLVGGR